MAKIFKLHEDKMTTELPEIDYSNAPPFSEQALAIAFAETLMERVRYVAAWNKWLLYDGCRWAFDEKRRVFSFAQQVCRQVAEQINKPNQQKALTSAKTRAAVISLASDDQRLAASVDQWDADLWLLNTPGGVVDLRTGKMREHRIDDYMTKCTAVTPDAKCPTPIWSAFLDKVTNENKDLQDYLARVCGYSLTGVTTEHKMWFFFGSGRNGKSVFLNTVANILGDYHQTAAIETFTVTHNEQHPTGLAMLRGARMVTAIETEEGRRWAESRIKAITGGDPIEARFMRQDFFRFWPQLKLLTAGNHKPGLRSVDEAIKSRIDLVPFNVFIPPDERDKDLSEKLKAEWPGILAWMMKGCSEWQRIGSLAAPSIVTDATKDYLDAEDTISQWIEDCCEVGKKHLAACSTLFRSWREWADDHGEFVIPTKRFYEQLDALGYGPDKVKGVRVRRGLRLKPFKPFKSHKSASGLHYA